MSIDELNGVIRIRDSMMSGDFMKIILVQRIRENIDNIHQGFDHNGTAEEMRETTMEQE